MSIKDRVRAFAGMNVFNHALWELVRTGLTRQEAEALAVAVRNRGMRALIRLEETGVSVYKRPIRCMNHKG